MTDEFCFDLVDLLRRYGMNETATAALVTCIDAQSARSTDNLVRLFEAWLLALEPMPSVKRAIELQALAAEVRTFLMRRIAPADF